MLLQLPNLKIMLVALLYWVLPLSIGVNASEIGFEPSPGNGSPQRTTAGGSRNPGYCPSDRTVSQPLAEVSSATDVPGQTSAQPTDEVLEVRIQVPNTSARAAEFSLFDEFGKGVYQTVLALGDEPGIVRIALPEASFQFQASRRYRWVFSLICQPEDRLQDRSISGWIQPNATSTTQN